MGGREVRKRWSYLMCMVDSDDDRAIIYERTWPKARKQYWCGECGTAIVIGEKHEKHVSLFDGSWTTHRICLPCSEATDWLLDECDGFVFGSVYLDIKEHLVDGEVRPDSVVLLLKSLADGMAARMNASRVAARSGEDGAVG